MKKIALLTLPLMFLVLPVQGEDLRNKRPDWSEYTYYSPKPTVEAKCFKCKTNNKSMCKVAKWHKDHKKTGEVVYVCNHDNKCRNVKLKKNTTLDYFVWEYEKNVCVEKEKKE